MQYHQWDIRADACALGEELGVPVYRFLKESLIRRFGMDWYMALEAAAKYLGIED